MGDISPLKDHRFRGKLVEVRRVNLDASVASERIRSLLIRQKKNQIRSSLCGHRITTPRTKSVLPIDCNDSTVAVALRARRALPTGKRLQEHCGFLKFRNAGL